MKSNAEYLAQLRATAIATRLPFFLDLYLKEHRRLCPPWYVRLLRTVRKPWRRQT